MQELTQQLVEKPVGNDFFSFSESLYYAEQHYSLTKDIFYTVKPELTTIIPASSFPY